MKWSFLPKDRTITTCANFDEPSRTFNNRYLVDHDPHQPEGILIAGYATRATTGTSISAWSSTNLPHPAAGPSMRPMCRLFGRNIFGTDYSLECYIHRGAGFMCGDRPA